jgi:hypothetical protein
VCINEYVVEDPPLTCKIHNSEYMFLDPCVIIGRACACKNVENIGRYELLLSGTDEARIPFRNSGAWDPPSNNRDLCGTGATVGTFRMRFLRIGRDMLQVEQLRVRVSAQCGLHHNM